MRLLMIIYQYRLLEWSYTSWYEITDDNISMEFVGMVIHKWTWDYWWWYINVVCWNGHSQVDMILLMMSDINGVCWNGHTQVDMRLLMIIYQCSLLEWSYTSWYEITDDNISMELVGMVIHKWIWDYWWQYINVVCWNGHSQGALRLLMIQ